MEASFSKKHPYSAAISAAFLCTCMTVIGAATSQIMGFEAGKTYLVMSGIIFLSIIIGLVIMKRSRISIREYGFRKPDTKSARNVWYYVPLFLVEGISFFGDETAYKEGVSVYLTLLLFCIMVGFHEEIYFRGLVFGFLGEKGKKIAILVSSSIFGVLHLANALGGQNIQYTCLQIGFAFLVGIVLAELVSITKSLWMVIIWHSLHDFIASSSSDVIDTKELIVSFIQILIFLIYAIVLWKKSTTIVD
ncbi:MAG: lysostaphin resistance A-like protein [Velocimicrobium sp.]